MAESVAQWFTETFPWLPHEVVVLIISMIPIIELRGGIPVASLIGFSLPKAFALCILGNMIPVPLILWFITPVFSWLKKRKIFRPLVEKLEARSLGKKSDRIRKYEFWGLVLFVGIPLPGTGAWTGSLIASLLNIKKSKAILAVFCGVLLASVIIGLFSYGLPALIEAWK